MFSPDGKLLYFFADDVLIYDTTDVQAGRQVGAVAAGRGRAGPVQLRAARRRLRGAGLLHRHLHVTGSGAEPPHHGRRAGEPRGKEPRLLAARPGASASASRWRPIASTPTACFRTSATTSSGRSTSSTTSSARRTEFPGRPRMALRTSSNGKLLYIYQAGQHDRPLRSRDLQVPADDHARRAT